MLHLKKSLRRVINKIVGHDPYVLRAEINQIKDDLEKSIVNSRTVENKFYKSNESLRDLLIRSNLKKINVVYFFQQITIWNSFKSVYERMMDDERFDCKVVITSFKHDKENLENKESIEFLLKEKVPFSIYEPDSFDWDSVDVVFFQTPYDCSRPSELSVPSLVHKGIKVGYVPYGLDVGGGDDNLRWQYNLDCQNLAKWVFVRSLRHKEFFGKYCSSGNSHVYVTGHPKFDQTDKNLQTISKSADRKVFLWTPHFSLNEGGWSTFEKFSDTILSHAMSNDFDLIIRPHPLFMSRLDSCSDEIKKKYSKMMDIISEHRNITLDPCNGSYIDSFNKSDLLIADAGSFLLEYLPTRKPIIYLHNTDGPGLNESGAFTQHLYTANNNTELTSHMNSILSNDDYMKEERVSIINDELYISKQSAAHEICSLILDTYEVKH